MTQKPRTIDWDLPLLQALAAVGLEFDQRLYRAFDALPKTGSPVTQALIRLPRDNSISTRFPELGERLERSVAKTGWTSAAGGDLPIDRLSLKNWPESRIVLQKAAALSGPSTVSVPAFIRALRDVERDISSGHPIYAQVLAHAFSGDSSRPLKDIPSLQRVLDHLERHSRDGDDFQYILALEGSRIAFRVVSVLDDYVQTNSSGLYVPQRALLSHFKEQFGGFTLDEIEELESLINDSRASEREFQTFFENHKHFFRKWDYREVHPQVHLRHEQDGDLIPDFILTDRELQKSAILDLKLPSPRLIRRQRNRDRFAAAIMEAKAQLQTYRDYFEERANRQKLRNTLGMEIYRPHLSVVIGRAAEFQDEVDRARLQDRNAEIEIVTYDDILAFAKRRQLLIRGHAESANEQ